jgi:signal transduction histidine kinase
MGTAALVAPALIVQRLQGTELQVAAIAGAWAVLSVLVMGYMAGLVGGIERAQGERRRVLDRTVQAAEEERMQVAGLLHDGPIQPFPSSPTTWSGPSSGCSATRPPWPGSSTPRPPCPPRSRACRSSWRRCGPTLDQVGLEAALRDHVGAFARRSGVACSVRVDLEIRDDGVGFEPVGSSALVRDGHFGLPAMQERVEVAGGRSQVDTHPGAGVTLRAMFQVAAPS